MTRNSEALASFTQYCEDNPDQRFWQALRNWSDYAYVLGFNGDAHALQEYLDNAYYPYNVIETWNNEGLEGKRTGWSDVEGKVS